MKEIDVVVDVRENPETGELIALRQKLAFSGEASLVGSPVESRIGRSTQCVRPNFDRGGVTFHRRALPIFETLPEVDRCAILKAVAPLAGTETDQWSSAGAEPLEAAPFTFLLWTNDDLGVIVTRTDDKNIEVVDVVRRSSLDQADTPGEGSAT